MTADRQTSLHVLVAELEQHLATVPKTSSGIACSVCHGFRDGPSDLCSSCRLTTSQVSRPLTTVIPISLAPEYTQIYHILKTYKADYATAAQRQGMRLSLAAALTWFLHKHTECIGAWDTLVAVPSTRRPRPHPLEDVVSRSAALRNRLGVLLEVTQTPPTKRRATDDGFRTTEPVDGRQVLLIDDTFTSGASLQSAASRLALDGAEVVGAVVLGRFVRESWSNNQQFLQVMAEIPFSWDSCCVHVSGEE